MYTLFSGSRLQTVRTKATPKKSSRPALLGKVNPSEKQNAYLVTMNRHALASTGATPASGAETAHGEQKKMPK
jgi:hypothetical protein